jgi:hypothetical protein
MFSRLFLVKFSIGDLHIVLGRIFIFMQIGTWKLFFTDCCKWNFTPIFCSFLLMWMEFGTDSLHIQQVWISWKSVRWKTYFTYGCTWNFFPYFLHFSSELDKIWHRRYLLQFDWEFHEYWHSEAILCSGSKMSVLLSTLFVWFAWNSLSQIAHVLLSVCEFCENWQSEGHTFS